ncbi:MAG: hypothetical protein HPY66_1664 [Firmicutes bacterium]|nr:hypothetical protein [Bacillota bacterium]
MQYLYFGRQYEARKGMPPSHCKFQPDEVLEIYRRIKAGESYLSIAKSLNVSKGTILNIKHRKYYRRILEAKQ